MTSLNALKGTAAVVALGALALTTAPTGAAAQVACAANTTVTLSSSSVVCGTATLGGPPGSQIAINQYQGIRYGQAARWATPGMAPLPAGTTAAPFQATAAGAYCPQGASDRNEDCLFLNVSAPQTTINNPAAKRPVIFFIHGGAFVAGSGGAPLYDGATLAGNGPAVVVTINYRLGALGFLSYRNGSTVIPGNFGLLDQQLALAWVYQNIAAFGGDPGNITIVGESAGAMSVGLHLFAASTNRYVQATGKAVDSRALFTGAVMESNPMGIAYPTPQASSDAIGTAFVNSLCSSVKGAPKNCATNLSWLQSVPTTDQVMSAQTAAMKTWAANSPIGKAKVPGVQALASDATPITLPYSPVVDGALVMGQPLKGYASTYAANARPFVFGTNANEGAPFAQLVYDLNPIERGWIFDQKAYETDLGNILGKTAVPVIEAIDAYNPAKQSDTLYWSAAAAALSNVITDYVFTCANITAANNALAQSKATGVYGYHFTQPAIFDLYTSPITKGPMAACAPTKDKSGNYDGRTCHANELPYVFNTLPAVPDLQSPTSGDTALTQSMPAAWAAFAKTPASPGAPWVAYANDNTGTVIQWNGGTLPPPKTAVYAAANCATWAPYLK